MPDDRSDDECLCRWREEADEHAFATLVARHGVLVHAVARRVTNSAADADDVSQATFLILAQRPPTLRTPLAPWLHRVTANAATDLVRSREARREREQLCAAEPSIPPPGDDASTIVDGCLAALPERYRVPLVMHHLEGLSHEAVASRFGVSPGTVASWLSRGRERLRASLSRRGITVGAASLLSLLVTPAHGALPPSLVGFVATRATVAAHRLTIPKGLAAMAIAKGSSIAAVSLVGLLIVSGSLMRSVEPPRPEPVPVVTTSSSGGNAALIWYQVFLMQPGISSPLHHLPPLPDASPTLSQASDSSLDSVFATRPDWLRLADRAAGVAKAQWSLGPTDEWPPLPLPHIGSAREWARLAQVHAVWTVMHGRSDETVDDIVAITALSEHLLRGGGNLIEALVGMTIASMGDGAAGAVLTRLSEPQRAKLEHRLASFSAESPWPAVVAAEISSHLALLRGLRSLPTDRRAAVIKGFGQIDGLESFTDQDIDLILSSYGKIAGSIATIMAGAPGTWLAGFDTLGTDRTSNPFVKSRISDLRVTLGMERQWRMRRMVLLCALHNAPGKPAPMDGHPIVELFTPGGDRLWSWRLEGATKDDHLWMPAPTSLPWIKRADLPGAKDAAADPVIPAAPTGAKDF